jgi:hypothetical protein
VNVRAVSFEGFAAIELRAGGLRLVIVHEVGPRIAWFGRDGGDNVLFWDRRGQHRRGDWRMFGGHRLWLTRPGADETEETYAPDGEPCRVRTSRGRVVVTAPADPQRLARGLAIRARPGGFEIEHRVENVGDMMWSGGIWALTCTAPSASTVYDIPLGDGTAWDVVTIVIPRSWGGGHTSRVDDPQIQLGRDHLRLRVRGREAKRMIRAPQGVIAMSDRRRDLGFVKRAAFDRDGSYPLDTNLALYVAADRSFVEMETMGPTRALAPGAAISHTELWSLQGALPWAHTRA